MSWTTEALRRLWVKIRTPKEAKKAQSHIDSFKQAFLDPLSELAGQEIPSKDISLYQTWKYDSATIRLNGKYYEVRFVEQEDGTIKFAPRKDWKVLREG